MDANDLMARTLELARTFDKRAQSDSSDAVGPLAEAERLHRGVGYTQQVLEEAVRPRFDIPAAQPQLMSIPSAEQVPAPGIGDTQPPGSIQPPTPVGEIGMATGAPEVAPTLTAPVPYSAGPAGIQGEVAGALQRAPQGVSLTPQEQFQSASRLGQKLLAAQTPEQRAEWAGRFQSPEMLNNLVAAMGRGQVGPQQLAALDFLQARSGSQLPLGPQQLAALDFLQARSGSQLPPGELGEDYAGTDPEVLERTRIADTMASALRENPALFDDPKFMERAKAVAGGEIAGWSSRLPDALKGRTGQLADEANRQAAMSAAEKAMGLTGVGAPIPEVAAAPVTTPSGTTTPTTTPSGDVAGHIPDLAGALDAPAMFMPAPMPPSSSAMSAPPPPIAAPTPPAPVTSLPMLPPPAPVPTPVVAAGPQPAPTAAGEMGMKSWGQQVVAPPDVQWAAGGTPVGLPGAQRAPGGSPAGTLAVGGLSGRNPFTHVAALGILAPLLENLYQRQPELVKEAADLGMQAFVLATQDLKEFAGSESFQEVMAKVAVSIPGIDPKETEMLTKAAQAELVGRLLAHGQLFRMSVAPIGSES